MNYRDQILEVQESLKHTAFALTKNEDDAMDLTQDTILKLLVSENKYDEQSKFKNWTILVMRNLFLNNYRKLVRMPTCYYDTLTENLHTTLEDTPEVEFSHKEILTLISMQPDMFRVPMTLYLEGYSYNEIAEMLNLPLGTVKSRIFTMRKKLGKFYNQLF